MCACNPQPPCDLHATAGAASDEIGKFPKHMCVPKVTSYFTRSPHNGPRVARLCQGRAGRIGCAQWCVAAGGTSRHCNGDGEDEERRKRQLPVALDEGRHNSAAHVVREQRRQRALDALWLSSPKSREGRVCDAETEKRVKMMRESGIGVHSHAACAVCPPAPQELDCPTK